MVPLNLPAPLQWLLASRGSRRATVTTFLAGAIVILGASIAFACIPWAGQIDLENIDDGASAEGENDLEGPIAGADHSDVTGTGNGQGMVWCDVLDPNGFGQQYEWAEVRTDGDTEDDVSDPSDAHDVRLIVDDNNTRADAEVKDTDDTDGCASDLYLPEDEYTIDFQEDSFDNHDDSLSINVEPTYADNRDTASNGGSNEVWDNGHCMDTDQSSDETWNLAEDEDGEPDNDQGDSTTGDDEGRFPHPDDEANDQDRDVIDEGPHTREVDLDQFGPTPGDSGDDSDDDGHTDAAGLCITSTETFEHDNNDEDDNEKDNIQIEYGNAIPINILDSV